jgi:hypothetical protein
MLSVTYGLRRGILNPGNTKGYQMLIGYARTSTVEQVAGLEAQCAALVATGCSKLFSEQASSVGQRDQLAAVLEWVREGDTLVVARLDRLARSTADLLGIVATLEGKQVGLRILDFGGSEVDTRSPTRRMRQLPEKYGISPPRGRPSPKQPNSFAVTLPS